MGLFSGLEALGFKTADLEVYSKEKNSAESDVISELPKEEKVIKEEDYLFRKTYNCPICDNEFKTLTVRAGKVRSNGHDEDLRPLYKEIDPLKYDAVVCPKCGYAALSKYFDHIIPMQRKSIRAEIEPKFKGIDESKDFFDYDEAIIRYKMVLMCDVVGSTKDSRKAYTCLKLAWVIRGKLEKEGESLPPSECETLHADEMECIQNAYDGYMLAFSHEDFPMSGMDEVTIMYLTAALAFRLEKYRESLQLLSKIMENRAVSSRIKEIALDLKDKIRAQVAMKEKQ